MIIMHISIALTLSEYEKIRSYILRKVDFLKYDKNKDIVEQWLATKSWEHIEEVLKNANI